jgi:hypothetical protein
MKEGEEGKNRKNEIIYPDNSAMKKTDHYFLLPEY